MDVGRHDVEDGAEQARVLGEEGEGLGGRDGAGVGGGAEAEARGVDQGAEGGGGGVRVEEGFVADDEEGDEGPFCCWGVCGGVCGGGPGDDVGDLGGCGGGAVVEGDAEDEG